jgi:peptidoglycan/xylan/chitin deacetylase (PgdA/CDA1 family)
LHWKQYEREEFIAMLEKKFEVPMPDTWNLMNWGELKKCVDAGVAIGSHSLSHDSLVTIGNEELLMKEIAGSKKILESKLGIKVETFAFPNGLYDDRSFKVTLSAGYKYLLCTKESLFSYKSDLHESGTYIIPRITVNKKSLSENLLAIENFHNIIRG